jgi:ABC-type amino acid transport substrate-binding protein
MAIRRRGLLTSVVMLAMLSLAPSKPVMRYVYDGPESARDVRYLYHWDILRTALEKTRPKWGEYLMVVSDVMTEPRQQFELLHATGKLNVMYLSTTPEFERKLVGIHIPVDKNLGGYCVFLIRDAEQPRFANVRTLDDLRKFSYGLGLGWIDVGILRANRFDVVTGSSYDGLFAMLAQKRFDILLRAATEVFAEYEKQGGKENRLAIEKTILFYYPMPMYFWFPKTEEGRRLAARAEEGMRMMIADGTYDQIFDRYQRHKIETLRLKERKLFTIKNPNVGPETPFADKRLWFDPKTYR